MTPEEHRMLEETRALVEENRNLLESIRRTNRANMVFKVLYWVVIILLSFGAYYLVQPYVDTLRSSLNDISNIDLTSLK